METHEPSNVEVAITVAAGTIVAPFYSEYVARLELRGDERVLDFGSGAGTPARLVARRLQRGGHLTCVDLSARWLAVARRRLRRFPDVTFRRGVLGSLGLADESFDLIIVHFVLHDIPAAERPSVVAHLARVLARRGRLCLREPLRFIGRDEIRRLAEQADLVERAAAATTVVTQGVVYEGTFTKPPAA